tara:strand:- start:64919 stop:65803 length:885 start_codon:yes stop_codon:yes gene_type:complete
MSTNRNIAELMCKATEIVYNETFELHQGEKLNVRVGRGAATNYKHRKREITYGVLMLESKLTLKSAERWTTGMEILKRKYFNSEFTYQNLIVATILHEYSHFIQRLHGQRPYGEMHNDYFYNILDLLHERKELIQKIREYLEESEEFKNANFTNTDTGYSKAEVMKHDFLSFSKEEGLVNAKIVKCNPKRVLVCTKDGVTYNLPYSYVENLYNDDDLFYNYKDYKKKTSTIVNASEFKDLLGCKEITIKLRGKDINGIIIAMSNKSILFFSSSEKRCSKIQKEDFFKGFFVKAK